MLYINYPSWLHPQIFPNIPFLSNLRWYGLMYIFAFATALALLLRLLNEGFLDTPLSGGKVKRTSKDEVYSFITCGILFLIIGARIFSALVYDTTGIYRQKPYLIFWPFNEQGRFTGLMGMSYHGGFIGGLLGMIIWCKLNKKNTLQWIDAMVCCIPLGYTFGRLGNFFNGELYGRVTTAPWGVVFPLAEKFSANKEWVVNTMAKIGMTAEDALVVNLPRHPSQLYEAFFEGVVLWLILYLLHKNKHRWHGMLGASYTIGYGAFRFFIEYFRQPDTDLGYRIAQDASSPLYLNTSLLNFSTGQILCFLMITGGILMLFATRYYAKVTNSLIPPNRAPSKDAIKKKNRKKVKG